MSNTSYSKQAHANPSSLPTANITSSSANALVADHYNARPNLGKESRAESLIYNMKNFNNWVKSILISKYLRPGYSVLDMCGGKGGDLLKWTKGRIAHLVLADVALISVKHALERYNSLRNITFPAIFICADCFEAKLSAYLPPSLDFDFVSVQFSLHYAFETEERARAMLRNVTEKLRPGGYFVGTIPDSYYIVKRLRNTEGLSFGNSVYSIKFDQKEHFPAFGCKYRFFLEDAVDSVPEYLVHFPTFQSLAAEYGLELRMQARFHDFYQQNIQNNENIQLLYKMNCLNAEGTISPDEWEASGLYLVFAFQKTGVHHPTPPHPEWKPKRVSEEEIIIIPPKS
jgi:mRNA (guanine-N7-)-methyltransferase